MKLTKKLLKNSHGFSMVEMLIAMGLSAIVIGAANYMIGDNHKYQALIGKKMEQSSDLTLGRAIIYKDLRLSSPTFYFFNTKANFYEFGDYDESRPSNCMTFSGTEKEFWFTTLRQACRGLEIKLSAVGDSFWVAAEDNATGSGGTMLSPEDVIPGASIDKDALHDFLVNSNIMVSGKADRNYKVQASTSILIGDQLRSYGAIFNADTLELVYKDVLYDIPDDFCKTSKLAGGQINSLEDFLRCLPGSGVPRVKVTPINLIKYEVAKKDGKGPCGKVTYLQRTTTRSGRSDAGFGLLDNLSSVRFYRDNTASTSIWLDVNFVPAEDRSTENCE